MAEVKLDAVPQKVRDFFNKGFGAFERRRLDYAIDMLSTCLELEPALLQARKFLRAAEVQKYRAEKTTAVSRLLGLVGSVPAAIRAMIAMQSKDPMKGVIATDRLLRDNPLHKPYIFMFAHASEKAGIPEAAVQMLEIAKEHHADDPGILQELGRGFQAAGDSKKAIACFERLCDLSPNDPKALKELKDAMALDSLTADGWQDAADGGGSFRDMIKDTDEAVRLEQQSKAVKSEHDLEELIADARAKIEAEPENVNHYRSLARMYAQQHDYDNAIATVQNALKIAPGDPEVENSLSDLQVRKVDAAIEALRAEGKEEEAAAKTVERDQLEFDNLQDRVARYPNDLNLRFKFGVVLYENDYFTEAVQQFQLSQRNPQYRPRSLYYLGMCFKAKGQLDLAVEQLDKAATELTNMDAVKKGICYALGEVHEMSGDRDKAAGYFKQIYQVDIQFRDVADKVENVYSDQAGGAG